MDYHNARRKDPELRTAVEKVHSEFSQMTGMGAAYFSVLRELSILSDSPFAFALEFVSEATSPSLEAVATCTRTSDETGNKLWIANDPSLGFVLPINQSTKMLYSLLSFNQPAVFFKHQLSEIPFDPNWPKIHSMLAIPVNDSRRCLALLIVCNSTRSYHVDFVKRCWPLLTTLISMVKVLAGKNNSDAAQQHLVLKKDSWRESFLLIEANSPIGMITLNKELEIIRINPTAEKIFNILSIHCLGKEIKELLPERFPNEHKTQTFSQHTGKSAIRLKGVTPSGNIVPVEVTLIRFNEYFQPRLLLMLSDATELHQIQDKMNREIQRFRALADLAPMGILQTDSHWKTDYINQRWLDMCGIEEHAMQGLNWCNTFHPEEVEEIITELHKSLVTGKVFERECRIIRTNEEIRWVKLHAQPLVNSLGNVNGFLATLIDNTYFHTAEEKLRLLAELDPLTKLANRSLFLSRLNHALTRLKRKGAVALLSLDLDGFKNVNDSLGHEAGDQLLIKVAERLLACMREEDTVSRIGGDEFNILLEDIVEASIVANISEKILAAIASPFMINNQEVFISASIGICFAVTGQNNSSKALLKQADMALYRAKAEGRNNYQYFSPELDQASRLRLELGNSLHKALSRAEFEAFYQMQADVKTGEIIGFEALLRWHHPVRGLLSPDEFIPLLEEIGLIASVSRWTWHASFFQLRKWLDEGLVNSNAVMSVNLSPRQFRDPLLVSSLANAIKDAGLDGHNIVLEITETALLQENSETLKVLENCKLLGVKIALDDFGTGYSSLRYLKKYPIDIIKIDKSFILDLLTDKEDAAITQAVLALAKSLQLEVIAEGVETDDVLQQLREWECTHYQGYLLNKPLPHTEVTKLLKNTLHLPRSPLALKTMNLAEPPHGKKH